MSIFIQVFFTPTIIATFFFPAYTSRFSNRSHATFLPKLQWESDVESLTSIHFVTKIN